MIHILSWTTKKHQKTLSRPLHSKLKKFNEFPRKNGIQELFKTVRTLIALSTGLISIHWEARLVSLIFIHWIVIYPVDSAIHLLNN